MQYAVASGPEPGEWVIRATRASGAHSADGSATLRLENPPDGADAPHAGLAGARAWLALARSRLEAGDVDEAIAAARAGITELGRRYAPADVKDDTELKRLNADERIARGHKQDAAEALIRVLDTRVGLYARRYADIVVG